jgi:hypothetical protein
MGRRAGEAWRIGGRRAVGHRGGITLLFGVGKENPSREYVENWLGRKQKEGEAIAAQRHEEATRPAKSAAKYARWAFIVSLILGIGALSVAVKQCHDQEVRWSEEDGRLTPVDFKVDTAVTADGWRYAVVGVSNQLPVDLQIIALEAVSPDSLYLAKQRPDDAQMKGPVASAPMKRLMVGYEPVRPDRPGVQGWGMGFYVKTDGTPNSDHGKQLRIRVVMREKSYPNHSLSRDEIATIP